MNELGIIRYYCWVSSGELYKEQIKGGGLRLWVVESLVVVVFPAGRRRKGKMLPQNPQSGWFPIVIYWGWRMTEKDDYIHNPSQLRSQSVGIVRKRKKKKKNVDQANLTRWPGVML